MFVTQEFRALFFLLDSLSFSLTNLCFNGLEFFYSLDSLFAMQESRALFFLWIVCLLRKSLVHCSFSRLFVCYLRVSCTVCSLDCLFVTQESRALFVLWIVCLFRKSLAHGLFSGLFVCNARVSCTGRSLDCLFVTQESRALSVLWIVIQESRALSVLWIVFLFRKVLQHCLFSGLFVCDARVSRTGRSLDCLFVTQESRALSVLWIVIQESRALFVLWIVCLLRESLAHCRFSGLFVCNARVSCTIFSLDCLFVTQEFRALFFLLDSLSFSLTNLCFNGLEFCTVVF